MQNIERKALLLKSGLVRKVKQFHKAVYRGEEVWLHEFLDENNMSFNDYIECNRINYNTYKRDERIRERILSMLEYGACNFLTLTFSDETLAQTSRETRRKYITRYLKSVSDKYVANIDFGAENGREHYHAIVIGRVDYTSWHQYGSIKGEFVKNHLNDYKRVAKYVSKLTNHAIKNTTKGNRILYSR